MSPGPHLIRYGDRKLPVEQVLGYRQVWAALGRDAETTLPASANAVLLHQLLHPLLAHPNAPLFQFPPNTRPAVSTPALGVDRSDLYEQSLIAEMAS